MLSDVPSHGNEPLAFKEHYFHFVLDEDRVLLLAESGEKYLLKGEIYAQVARLLDGTRTMDQIVEALCDVASPEKTYFALMQLAQRGYISRAFSRLPKSQLALWDSITADRFAAAQGLESISVSVVALGSYEHEASLLRQVLEGLNIDTAEEHSADLVVVLVEDYLQNEIADLTLRFREKQKLWLPVKPTGQIIWLGPIFGQNGGPCWECLAVRIRENRIEHVVVEEFLGRSPVLSKAALPSTRALAVDLASIHIAKWAAKGGTRNLDDHVWTFDVGTFVASTHKIHKDPCCLVCGTAERYPADIGRAVKLHLRSRPKTLGTDGGYRVREPEVTYSELSTLVSPITGIAPDLSKISGSEDIHVYQVKQNSPLDDKTNKSRLGRPNGASGKGQSDIQAKVSCLAEAIERYSCVFRGIEWRKKARFSDFDKGAIHPTLLLNFSSRQYAQRESWNERNPGFNWVPEPFDDSKEIEWTPNWSLTKHEIRWLPTAYCYFSYPHEKDHEFCRGDSNGCASGNNLEEAILQGFLELVERDAMALFWYNRLRRSAICLESFNDAFLKRMEIFYRSKGRSLIALDITSDLGIPVVAAISWKNDGSAIIIGLGAHLDFAIAVSRAVSELNQMLPVAEAWDESKVGSSANLIDDPQFTEWMRDINIGNQPYFLPADGAYRIASEYPKPQRADLLDDIEACVQLLAKHNLEMIVLNLTRSDINFSTVRVTVPGLRHFWARFAAGRLYDVPLKLGWLPRKLEETELNSIPCFL